MKNIFYIISILFLFACDKDKEIVGVVPVKDGVFICNEGNFTYGNATLSVYDPAQKSIQNQIYARTNDGVSIGDVFQSMKIVNGNGFMVMNNSEKIIVIDIDTYKHIGKIEGLTSPRYIEVIDDTKIYISDLKNKSITIINPKTLQKTGSIDIGSSTEQMVQHGDYVYACSWSFGNKVFRINTITDEKEEELTVRKQPNSMVLDKNGKIWVLSDGAYEGSSYGQEIAALTRIDAATFTIEQVYYFSDIKFSPSRLSINSARDEIFFILGGYKSNSSKSIVNDNLNGVYNMSVDSDKLSERPLIPESGQLFYALGIDPSNGDIYIGDAIDYSQKGIILRYSSKGEILDKFKTDIIPGSFCFTKD